jgi:hypothetical protein
VIGGLSTIFKLVLLYLLVTTIILHLWVTSFFKITLNPSPSILRQERNSFIQFEVDEKFFDAAWFALIGVCDRKPN